LGMTTTMLPVHLFPRVHRTFQFLDLITRFSFESTRQICIQSVFHVTNQVYVLCMKWGLEV
jgi:hypothetical protein